MEVPRMPHPVPFPRTIHNIASSTAAAVENIPLNDKQEKKLQEETDESLEYDPFGEEEEPIESVEVTDKAIRSEVKLSSQDSFSEELSTSEERKSAEEAERIAKEEEAAKERAAQRQLMAVQELVHSERSYLRMLQVSTVTIRSNLQKLQPPLANLDSMFLYIEDVIDVSSRLLSLLDQKHLQPGDPLFLEALCDAFLSLSSEIEAAYKEYLTNYNRVTVVENSYKKKEALWDEIVKVIKTSAPEVNASSLSFFLVMPVQRIARYPLLLQTIQKHTDTRHPAYTLLEQAAHTSIALNCRINEYKRFREVADKYKKTETLSIMDKINRLSSHSIAKKTARIGQFIKHETGMAPKLVDEEFDALECFFYILEHGILELLDNVELYLHHLQRFLRCKTEEFDLDMDGEKAPICYKEITTALRQWILPTFEKRMRTLIHKPLCALRDLLVGPRNLIRKRLDKLLDYEVIEAKSSLSYEEQAIANTYKTINTLLLNELPKFNGLALQMIWSMLGTFSCLHKDLTSDMEQLFQSFAQQLPHSSFETGMFWEWAESAVLEGSRRLETLCHSVEETLLAPAVQPLGTSSQLRLKQLTDKHGSGKIYQVMSAVVGSRDLDLSLSKGELVAVISHADTRGDRRRWLVDAGGRRGYAPCAKLIRYHQPADEPPPSPHPPLPQATGVARRHSYTPEIQQTDAALSQPCFQVFAAYSFTARGNHEVSIMAGEPVRVLEPHDKRGSREWSLVEVRGRQRGYVPSNYLALVPVGAGSLDAHQPRC
ncbi:rho guanine nucleotide exchange factor 37 [Dunckerocampus dactyliophorus]|uniref:rho guanine nucleotide exchange factor 37 n=1 Tax=Dunckerocampus dactyliophorus TaxID=161453 RepID=UPI0024065A31|nr:rho guanine nucleotide exchange factor 37 [Dunckerocampus dactyliophorus]XP_054647828.1 rho guanine nucleotide exchange factor 37 [Dunckerocampus dactyliophorus]XP_054647829.1 rho guanine nucleotide exchange factor 37 [Dunckerocampus dactyliophorus]XP_054647830.1 rho guanine nucleotide exchange factor 37 [Dunckerocampus dactyliophorus]XP_054647831.1 rho guanine nucleotide exchange factor 37 [Dunckerocampus dactyliophorus]